MTQQTGRSALDIGFSRQSPLVLPGMACGPHLQVLDRSGCEDVAWVHVARWSQGPADHLFEFVDGCADGLPRYLKWVINVSTQLGCPVGCHFCDAGSHYQGDLTAAQILAQVQYVLESRPTLASCCPKLKVHFSRMGEPALNPAVLQALEQLPGLVQGPGLWACLATSAPVASRDWLEQLLVLVHRLYPGRFQLQFSVNSTDESARRQLMPVPLLSLPELSDLATRFYRPGYRKVVLNFALADQVACDPAVLASLFDPACCAVKLTPVNPTFTGLEHGLKTILRSEREVRAKKLADELLSRGFDVVLSIGDPAEDDVGSNCGQSVMRLLQR